MEKEIISLIENHGPLTGSEIWEAIKGNDLMVWRSCKVSDQLVVRHVGCRYLRLDRQMEGFARLSPSIWREFLTYSVVGVPSDLHSLENRCQALASHIEKVNKVKLELAWRTVSGLASRFESGGPLDRRICVIIAGDIVHNMAHDVPRPERSTRKMVNGSDMDLVVIVEDHAPPDFIRRLDQAIYEEKYKLLITPHLREEIDYVVKKVARVQKQVRFDTFKRMVACKVLNEGTFLYGREDLFTTVKTLLREQGVTERLNDLERQAIAFRKESESYLLHADPETVRENLHFFYPTEESEEFE